MPKLADIQNQFCERIRDPENTKSPVDISANRMQVYQELIYNNVEEALITVFPICHKLLSASKWQHLIRQFLVEHQASKPLYRQISEEFLQFLLQQPSDEQYPYLTELAHFEWIELALDVDQQSLDQLMTNSVADINAGMIHVSPLAWNLVYRYPVLAMVEQQCELPLEENNVFIIAYRDRHDQFSFYQTEQFTYTLLDMLTNNTAMSARQLFQAVAEQYQQDLAQTEKIGLEILQQLQQRDIIFITKETSV